ncbi:MAG: DUF1631 family protein [Gammaproteobacteria bacterium]|nr:DUF1631 family protein [Gammaproteobacteria bacterium]
MLDKGQIRQILLEWQGRIGPAADARLEKMFASADEVLFDYADKAESNAIQVKFLGGRQELWSRKSEVAVLFRDTLAKQLFQFAKPAQRPNAPGSETLSLVSKDSFERSLALQTISDQAVEKNRELYYALSLRLGAVSGNPAVPYEDLPAGPHQLAGVFEHAAQILNVERQVLLALYTLFEREVIRESPPWHDELNAALRDKGILPHLKYTVKRDPDQLGADRSLPKDPPQPGDPGAHAHAGSAAPGTPPSAARHAGAAAYHDPEPGNPGAMPRDRSRPDTGQSNSQLGEQMLGRIRELLTARRANLSRASGQPVRPDPVSPAPASTIVKAIESDHVQQAVPVPSTGALDDGVRRVIVSRELLEKVRTALMAQREMIKDEVGEDKLSHLDEDTIDIVGMLFEVMLDDERLNDTVKALLSHLHTPYLKLAVRDRAFLTRPDHPARHLFDNMIIAGTRWVDESDLTRGIYPKLQRVVDLILKAGEHPLQLLQELDEGLSAEIALRSRRQEAREVRTVEAEKGKARLEEARDQAAQATQPFLEQGETPANYLEFITGAWSDYLTLLYLRSNGDTRSDSWHSAVALCGQLRAYVDAWVSGRKPGRNDLQDLRRELLRRLRDTIPHYESKVEQLFEMFSTNYKLQIVTPPPAAPAQKDVSLSQGGRELLKRLPNLPSGSWVVFKKPDGADLTVKLSWFNPKTERFLFVDQAGAKALVVPLAKLADQIDRDQAHVLHATGTSYVETSLQRALNTLEQRA